MNILYVYAHPNPDSFNAMLKQYALKILSDFQHNVTLSDLYKSQFKAIADWDDFEKSKNDSPSQYFLAQQIAYQHRYLSTDITMEIEKIILADHIIFQFPLWWFSAPAILKGWFDRMLVKGFAYDAGKTFNEGLLKGKTASLTVTTQSPESAYQMTGAHKAGIDTFLHSIHHTLHFVGISTMPPLIIFDALNLSQKRIEDSKIMYQDYLRLLDQSNTTQTNPA